MGYLFAMYSWPQGLVNTFGTPCQYDMTTCLWKRSSGRQCGHIWLRITDRLLLAALTYTSPCTAIVETVMNHSREIRAKSSGASWVHAGSPGLCLSPILTSHITSHQRWWNTPSHEMTRYGTERGKSPTYGGQRKRPSIMPLQKNDIHGVVTLIELEVNLYLNPNGCFEHQIGSSASTSNHVTHCTSVPNRNAMRDTLNRIKHM